LLKIKRNKEQFMKKYEFVHIALKNNPATNATLSEHRQVIGEYAAKGYTYKGYIPTLQGASGKTVEIDLIFETEA